MQHLNLVDGDSFDELDDPYAAAGEYDLQSAEEAGQLRLPFPPVHDS